MMFCNQDKLLCYTLITSIYADNSYLYIFLFKKHRRGLALGNLNLNSKPEVLIVLTFDCLHLHDEFMYILVTNPKRNRKKETRGY